VDARPRESACEMAKRRHRVGCAFAKGIGARRWCVPVEFALELELELSNGDILSGLR
jgi:hypothetical protein